MGTARSTPAKQICLQDLISYRDLVVGSQLEIEQIISKHQKVTFTEGKEKRKIINIHKIILILPCMIVLWIKYWLYQHIENKYSSGMKRLYCKAQEHIIGEYYLMNIYSKILNFEHVELVILPK